MSGSQEVIVSFACNNPDNGRFTGRATMLHWQTKYGSKYELEFDHDDWEDGTKIEFNELLMKFTLHNEIFPYKSIKHWYGNWCWEGIVMKKPAAKRLLKAILESKEWNCTCAPVHFMRMIEKVAAA